MTEEAGKKLNEDEYDGIDMVSDNPDSQKFNDWIFYSNASGNICKRHLDEDGENHDIQLNEDDSDPFNVSEDWIYYFNNGDGCIYKMRTDGSEKAKLIDLSEKHGKCGGICVIGNRIVWINQYWFAAEGCAYHLHTMQTDGTKDDFAF